MSVTGTVATSLLVAFGLTVRGSGQFEGVVEDRFRIGGACMQAGRLNPL